MNPLQPDPGCPGGVVDYPSVGGPQDMFYSRSIVPLPVIQRAAGIYMWDEEGNEYIDASSGPVVSNIGHGNARVARAMAEQACRMDFAYSRVARHRPNMALTERIAYEYRDESPWSIEKYFVACQWRHASALRSSFQRNTFD